jgi:hypothetical protein
MPDMFKPADDMLKELVDARRKEVEHMQQSRSDQIKDLERRGQARIASLRKTLPREVLDAFDKTHDEASAATQSHVESVKARLAASAPPPEGETAIHPGLGRGHLAGC